MNMLQQHTKETEEKFDEELLTLQGQSDYSKYIPSFHHAKLKSFITSRERELYRKTLEKDVEMLKYYKDIGETVLKNDDWKEGHRYALQNIINKKEYERVDSLLKEEIARHKGLLT